MWKLFRSPRTLLPSPRTLLASPRVASSVPHGQVVHVHRVKFTRPARSRLRNFFLGGAVLYGCYTIYTSVVLSPVARYVEVEEENLTATERKALEEELDKDIFIAFPFTTHAVLPPPFSGRDPEWLEFVRMSKDKPLLVRIRDDLAYKARRAAEASLPLTMRVGKPLKVRRHWLDIDYPYGPPVEYHRSGILMTDEGLEWATRPVDSAVVNAVNRVLWPSPLFLSAWAFAGTMFKLHVQEVLRALGFQPRSPSDFQNARTPHGTPTAAGNTSTLPSEHHPDIQRAIQRLQQQATKRPEEVKDPRAMASQNEGGAAYGAAAAPLAPAGSSRPPETPGKPKADQARADTLLPGQAAAQSKVSEPWMAFMRTFAMSLKRAPEQPPSGSVRVSGLVELEAPKGWVVLDVMAFWDPKTRKFDEKSMMMRLRRFQPKNQAPIRR